MSPHLFLVRHAPAIPHATGGDDRRSLTVVGLRVAAIVGEGLTRLLQDDAHLLTSPARRCRETAEAIAAALGRRRGTRVRADVCAELAVDAPLAALRELAHSAAAGTVLVGHQPELLGLATSLVAPASIPFGLPPGGVLGLSPANGEPVGPWQLDLAATPDDLERLSLR